MRAYLHITVFELAGIAALLLLSIMVIGFVVRRRRRSFNHVLQLGAVSQHWLVDHQSEEY